MVLVPLCINHERCQTLPLIIRHFSDFVESVRVYVAYSIGAYIFFNIGAHNFPFEASVICNIVCCFLGMMYLAAQSYW